jgi:hypothetical protein
MSNNNENIRGKIAVIKGGSSDMAPGERQAVR